MKKFNKFYFEKFDFDEKTLKASFFYSFDKELYFEENIFFDCENFILRNDIKKEIINNILFHIHIALWISYYKFFPTSKLIIENWTLDDFQINFWKKFYLNWLWEFFYKNNINPNGLINFVNNNNKITYEEKVTDFNVSEKFLVPIWWWKDSIVSIELLKKMWKEITWFTFTQNDNLLYDNTANNAWIKRLIIKRQLSKNILEVIKLWYYNWHVPITWIIAFVMEMIAYLYDYKYLVLSNELSANFWNTIFNWISINHQWSKSVEFEKDFSLYISNYVSKEVKYFSLLRPFYELQIAFLFSKFAKKYFSSFSSCNNNFKIFNDKNSKSEKNIYWCNTCPKCVFVYIILRAYLDKKDILNIFGKELYEDKSLEKLFRELAWISWIKPFECVWTNEEVILAMKMAYDKWEWDLPFILEIFKNEIKTKITASEFDELTKKILTPDYENNCIPEEILNNFKKLKI